MRPVIRCARRNARTARGVSPRGSTDTATICLRSGGPSLPLRHLQVLDDQWADVRAVAVHEREQHDASAELRQAHDARRSRCAARSPARARSPAGLRRREAARRRRRSIRRSPPAARRRGVRSRQRARISVAGDHGGRHAHRHGGPRDHDDPRRHRAARRRRSSSRPTSSAMPSSSSRRQHVLDAQRLGLEALGTERQPDRPRAPSRSTRSRGCLPRPRPARSRSARSPAHAARPRRAAAA